MIKGVDPTRANKIKVEVPGAPEGITVSVDGTDVEVSGIAEANDFETIQIRATVFDDVDRPVEGVDVEFRPKFSGKVPLASEFVLPTCDPSSSRTDADGIARTVCVSEVDGTFDIVGSFIETPIQKPKKAKVTVVFLAAAAEVELLAKKVIVLPKPTETTAPADSDSVDLTASVNWGRSQIPNIPILLEVDKPTIAALSKDGGITLSGKVQGRADETGFFSVALFPIAVQKDMEEQSTSNGESVLITATAEVDGEFVMDTETVFVGGPSVVRLEISGAGIVAADGETEVDLKASAVSFVGSKVGPVQQGTPFTFQTTLGLFPNQRNKMVIYGDSNGTAETSITSSTAGEAVVTVTVPLTDKESNVITGKSNAVSALFQKLPQQQTCLKTSDSIQLVTEEACGIPCNTSNEDDTSTTTVKENELKVTATVLDVDLKPVKDVQVTFCALQPNSVSVSGFAGATLLTDALGQAVATFRAGYLAQTTAVRAFIGCPRSDLCGKDPTKTDPLEAAKDPYVPCEEEISLCDEAAVTIRAGSGASIEFVNSPLKLGVKGTGKETGTITIQVMDKTGNPVPNGTLVNFSIQGVGGGESIDPSSAQTAGGVASTVVRAGSVSGTVKVLVSVDLPDSTSLISGIQNVAIESGPGVQNHLSMAREPINIRGFMFDGVTVDVTSILGDRYGNPATEGTTLWFSTEAGVIEGQAGTTVGPEGQVVTTLFSGNPRPKRVTAGGNCPIDGIATMITYTKGIEDFFDLDGDGLYIQDGGCVPGRQCSGGTTCAQDPFENNGTWDSCDDGNRNGVCDSTEPGAGVCAPGEDIFCVLTTIGCIGGSPCLGYGKLRPAGEVNPNPSFTPDKACKFVLHDTQEPFINADDDYCQDSFGIDGCGAGGFVPYRDFDEIFLDLNGNGKWDTFNGTYDTVAPVWYDASVIWSDSLISARTDNDVDVNKDGFADCPSGASICVTETQTQCSEPGTCASVNPSACPTFCIDTLGEGPCRIPDALPFAGGPPAVSTPDGNKDEFCIVLNGDIPNGGSQSLVVSIWDGRLLPVVAGSTLSFEVSGSGAEVVPASVNLGGGQTRVFVTLVDANALECQPPQPANCNPPEDVEIVAKLTSDNLFGAEIITSITCRVD